MEKEKSPMIFKTVFIVSMFLLSACTMSTQHYAMISTKQNGALLASKDAKPKTQVTGRVSTKLDQQLKLRSASADHTKYALIIGIENYKYQTKVNFAQNSAETFALAAENIFGIPKKNIVLLTNEEATSGQIKTKLRLMKELAEAGDSIYVYYAGHGVPANDGHTYILPSDMGADAISFEPQLMLNNIYAMLTASDADRVFVFVDSCFSGKSDDGQLLFEGVAPVLKREKDRFSSKKLSVITAGGPDDFSNQYKKEQQRLFTYFLVKGLLNDNENIDELYSFVRRNVKRESLLIGLGYKQVPQLQLAE